VKKITYLLSICVIIPIVTLSQNLKLWYKEPAQQWEEALPIGNGRLGAMVFGGVNEEILQLNEATLWSGGPANFNPNPESPKYLAPLRKAIFEKDYRLADSLARKMQGLFTDAYEPLGKLIIRQDFAGAPTEYYRDLNLANAVATTSFKVDDVQYTREIFASAPDQVIVVKLKASKKGMLNCIIRANSLLQFHLKPLNSREIALRGKAPSYSASNYVYGLYPLMGPLLLTQQACT
jgi:alpha-L-fucosidase 2